MTPAQEWGALLRSTMTRQRVPVKELSRVVGGDPARIVEWRAGRRLPLVENAAAVAEALVAPRLLDLCVALRTRRCEVCERTFVSNHRGGHAQRWCSPPCKWTGRARMKAADHAKRSGQRYDAWKRRAIERQEAIDAMCRGCEPMGACRDSECPLRPVSPLPLVPAFEVAVASPGTIRRHVPAAIRDHRREYNREWMRRKRAS